MQQMLTTSAKQIGCREDAEILAEWTGYDEDLPYGWEYIGEGSHRVAYISPAGVVYKKCKPGESDSNEMEYEMYLRLLGIPIKGWRLPQTELYKVGFEPIIAMEYVDGVPDIECGRAMWNLAGDCTCQKNPCSMWEWEKVIHMWNIIDVGEHNIIVEPNGMRVLIDIEG
jgi:hypothetical protein